MAPLTEANIKKRIEIEQNKTKPIQTKFNSNWNSAIKQTKLIREQDWVY